MKLINRVMESLSFRENKDAGTTTIVQTALVHLTVDEEGKCTEIKVML